MNNQQIGKIINYFRVNHNFHSPFTFLLDGNFIKLIVEKQINLEQKLKSLINGKIRLKVTSCTIAQLELLGREFHFILQKAKQFQIIKCKHSFDAVDQCMFSNALNEQSVIVCSQDKILRRKLRYKNIGIMYVAPDQRVTMQDIERHKLQDAKQAEKAKFLPNEKERQSLQEYAVQQKVLEKLKRKREEQKLAATKGVELKYIKKKKLKGPNPLSVKRKKNRTKSEEDENPEQNSNSDKQSVQKSENVEKWENTQIVQKKKRIRKKNKNKNGNKPQSDNNQN